MCAYFESFFWLCFSVAVNYVRERTGRELRRRAICCFVNILGFVVRASVLL